MTAFANDVVSSLPNLIAFARPLAGNRSLADDLVQETVLRALLHADQFHPGTNLIAWLTKILRNVYYNERRRQRRIDLQDPVSMPSRSISDEQEWRQCMRDVSCRFVSLPAEQREALVLVGAKGFSYADAAKLAGCATGTMKSRVSRARSRLQSMLDHGCAPVRTHDVYGPDREHLAKVA